MMMSEDNEVPAWTGDESPPIPGDGGADTQHSINNGHMINKLITS